MTAENQLKTDNSKVTSVLISMAILIFSVAIAFYVADSQKKVLQQILEGQAERTKLKLSDHTNSLVADLHAMSNRWVNNNATSEINWRADAENFIQRINGINAMWLINKDLKCQWLVPDLASSQRHCQALLEDSDVVVDLVKARESNVHDISKMFKSNGEHIIYIFQPIGRGENFDGFIAVKAEVTGFLDHVLGDPLNSGFYTKAYAGNESAYTNGPELSDDSHLEFFKLNLDDDASFWLFKVYPTESSLNLMMTKMPLFIAIVGALISILFMLTLWSKQKAKNQSVKLANEISEKEKVQFELEYLANHDTLTHLPNRHYITNFIEKKVKFSQSSQQRFTIFFIDLDHFKDINDTLGHAVGDEMLKKLPVLFNRVFRHDDVIARMGGDEFVVYLPGEISIEDVEKLVQRFLKSLEYPIQIEEHLIRLTGSVGVAFCPQHGANVTELLSHADAALYRAKDRGRNTFAIYDSEIEQVAKDRVKLISRLHLANENNEFEMYFQPRYSLSNNAISGAEALIRWNRGNKVEEPASFIGLLEETSLIIPISWRLLTQCCKQYNKLLEHQPSLFMSFNVSAKQLEHPDFLSTLRGILKETQFPPQNLELELTEQTLIQNVENSRYILNELTKMGIAIAIDDFGTGYSSLSYLKNFPVDVLKIDKSFIQDLDSDTDDLELVKTMIAMGKNLKITTVAEGVESKVQLELLQHESCDQVQGYFFKTPMKFYDYYQLISNIK